METVMDLEGQKINYLKIGNGPTKLLFFPGSFGTIWCNFNAQIEDLDKEEFTIIVLDPPGQGKSRPPERIIAPDMFERNADIIFKLIKRLNFQPFSLLGWCNGGITGMIYAAKYPETIRKLVIWGASSYLEREQLILFEQIRDIKTMPEQALKSLLEIYGENLLQELQNKWCDVMIEIEQNGGEICSSSLKRIKCPTLVLHGTKDVFLSVAQAEYLVKNIKNAKFYKFPDGKHPIHLQFAEEFHDVITKFLLT